jgi:hypothetical protein
MVVMGSTSSAGLTHESLSGRGANNVETDSIAIIVVGLIHEEACRHERESLLTATRVYLAWKIRTFQD